MAKTIQGFNTRLKEAMNNKGMKQVELCEKTGIGKSSMSHYINGTHSPTTDRVYLIAKALGVNEAWLLGYDVPMESDDEPIHAFISETYNTPSELFKSLEHYQGSGKTHDLIAKTNKIIEEKYKERTKTIDQIEELVKQLDITDFPRLEKFIEYQKCIKQQEYEAYLNDELKFEHSVSGEHNYDLMQQYNSGNFD